MTLAKYDDFAQNKVAEISKLAKNVRLKIVSDISSEVDIQYQAHGDHNIS
ncbi:MAG: hypothetical protein QNJ46_22350 [Leptolyngbyaceae cyanobacterium MO_188.B28]|nr:hypothetical protein [Leptolyngbyaceae cyanobacterium MO_188.B28]